MVCLDMGLDMGGFGYHTTAYANVTHVCMCVQHLN